MEAWILPWQNKTSKRKYVEPLERKIKRNTEFRLNEYSLQTDGLKSLIYCDMLLL
jgi:hypothetical protein